VKILEARGARVHPNSGAGSIKDDGSDDEYVYEVKDATKSFTLKSKELRATFVRAVRQGKLPMWLVYFGDGDFTAEIRLVPGGKELISE
jgi:hypothetical protein